MEPLDRIEDERLVLALRAGDQDAFGRLFDRWYDRVHDLARRVTRDDALAADVAQDAFLTAWQRLDRLEDPASFGGWVLRIARNRALDLVRAPAQARTRADEDMSAHVDEEATTGRLAEVDDPAAVAADHEVQELVWSAAATLGERDLTALDLSLRHGLEPAEIGEVLGINRNAANQLVHRMKGRLATAVRSRVLWRGGRPSCGVLQAALEAEGIDAFDARAVKVADRHAGTCTDCAKRRDLRLDPAQLFAAVPIVAVPAVFKAEAASALTAAGVPMQGSAAVGVGAPGADAGGANAGADGGSSVDGGSADGGPSDGGPGTEGSGDVGSADSPSGAGQETVGDTGAGDASTSAATAPGGPSGETSAMTEVVAPRSADGPPTDGVTEDWAAPASDDDGDDEAPAGRNRRRALVLGGVALLLLGAVLTALVLGGSDGDGEADDASGILVTDDEPVGTTTAPTTTEPAPTTTTEPQISVVVTPGGGPDGSGGDPVEDPPVVPDPGSNPPSNPPPPPPPPPPAPAPTGSVAVSPPTVPEVSTVRSTVSWSSGNATSVSISGPGLSSSAGSGAVQVCPGSLVGLTCTSAPGSYTYTLTVNGPGGTITRTATLTVA